jgi:cell division protein FtsB
MKNLTLTSALSKIDQLHQEKAVLKARIERLKEHINRLTIKPTTNPTAQVGLKNIHQMMIDQFNNK